MANRRLFTTGACAAALLVLLAVPAVAHPTFDPNHAPAGAETTAARLIIPHSCALEGGMPETDEDQSPTRIIDVQVPGGVTMSPHEKDGWTLVVTDDGFTWTADEPTETTITFDVDFRLDGEAGDAFHVGVYQECVNGESFSWIGTPDREAENPAAVLSVGEASGTEHPSGHGTASEHGTGHGTASEHMTDMGHVSEGMTPMDDMTEPMTGVPTEAAAEVTDDSGSSLVVSLAAVAAVVLLFGGGLLAIRGRRTND